MSQIIQLTDQTFLFSYIEHKPMYQYGHKPEWDNSGAVSDLMPVIEMTNKEEYAWIFDNDVSYEVVAIDHGRKVKHIRFTNIEDAMAFKLRWL